ncbi:hypothetical protein ACF1AX_18690 [Streptomyces sp. NPDC014802]|uniref:hypothetical protein n=1 Tax=Streptomyces sp. NPDC014802 TaxID=3364917 RepID=UPI0036F5B6E4
MSQPIGTSLPGILLPATSDISPAWPSADTGQWGLVFQNRFKKLHDLLDGPDNLPDAHSVRAAIRELATDIKALSGGITGQASAAAQMSEHEHKRNLDEALRPISAYHNRLLEFHVYDTYFGVTRSLIFPLDQFTAQLTATVIRLLDDLAHTLLNIDDVAALLYASELMLRHAQGDTATTPRDSESTNAKSVTGAPAALAVGPMYRWRLGHHFFALCAIFSRHCLLTVANQIPSGSPESMAELLDWATLTLRGTTAAMWYATNMSQAAYLGKIRPSMPKEFSGTQNLDYERLKQARESVIGALTRNYGSSLMTCPSIVRDAFAAHCEAEVQDLEHHTLIAASKVGGKPSLLGSPAVEMLRTMAQERREALAMFLSVE